MQRTEAPQCKNFWEDSCSRKISVSTQGNRSRKRGTFPAFPQHQFVFSPSVPHPKRMNQSYIVITNPPLSVTCNYSPAIAIDELTLVSVRLDGRHGVPTIRLLHSGFLEEQLGLTGLHYSSAVLGSAAASFSTLHRPHEVRDGDGVASGTCSLPDPRRFCIILHSYSFVLLC